MKFRSRIHEGRRHFSRLPGRRVPRRSPSKRQLVQETSSSLRFLKVGYPGCRRTCLPECRTMWSSWIRATTIPASGMGASLRLRVGRPKAAGLKSNWVDPVIKAFNNIYARHLMDLGRPANAPGRIALPIAGDNPSAKKVVVKLIDELGFDSVDAGDLDDSWRQQPGTPVYTADHNVEGVI